MKNIMVVPDVHGRKFWEAAMDYDGEVIFLGDYTDPYPSEGIRMDAAYDELLRIVDFKQRNPKRVTLLIGNHEMHYYDADYRCSRFSPQYYDRINALLTGCHADFFQVSRLVGKHLFIHAGLLKGWHDAHAGELSRLPGNLSDKLNNLFHTNPDAYYEVSIFRGGYHTHGSPLWADIREHIDAKESFDQELIQVAGHTRLKTAEPLEWKQMRFIDNQRIHLIRTED